MLIAIHQPNYLPWLGYFHKIARADVFVFLGGAQFSKGSYTNRVCIRGAGGLRWLTQPVRRRFGQAINEVVFADPAWARKHLDTLRNAYRNTPAFARAWPALEDIVLGAPFGSLAEVNRHLVAAIAGRLGLTARFVVDTMLGVDGRTGDDRLIALIEALRPNARYLSGAGGRKYQDEAKFAEAGIPLIYSGFEHPVYDQGQEIFVPGLSVVDALFHLGWDETRRLVAAD